MKNIIMFVLLALPVAVLSQDTSELTLTDIRTVKSPDNRVAVLELYTSEGCSSCPPADRFLSDLKRSGINSKQLIPMAFHVTYWDYIGWKDRFAKTQYDQRQRDLANKKRSNTVYTPQFVLSGDDYRRYASFSKDINELVMPEAMVDLELSVSVLPGAANEDTLSLKLKSDISRSKAKEIGLHFAVVENNLSSDVDSGENDGERLHHDYVVRQLSGPYYQNKSEVQYEQEQTIVLHSEWQADNLSIVAFAENLRTGEVLQAVRLKY